MYRHRKLSRADHIGYLVSVRASRSLTDIGLNMTSEHVRYGSEADITAALGLVRLVPISDLLPSNFERSVEHIPNSIRQFRL